MVKNAKSANLEQIVILILDAVLGCVQIKQACSHENDPVVSLNPVNSAPPSPPLLICRFNPQKTWFECADCEQQVDRVPFFFFLLQK